MNKTKKKPWRWDPMYQQAFDDVKAAIAKETVLAYPDFSKPFEIYTDASSTQLVAVITQDNSGNTKGVQRDAVGARNKSLHRSQKSHKRCPRTHL